LVDDQGGIREPLTELGGQGVFHQIQSSFHALETLRTGCL
jgi:hypothetical protein